MYKQCINSPEFIKELADLIMSGKHIQLHGGRGCGKSTFFKNWFEEVNKRLENNNEQTK